MALSFSPSIPGKHPANAERPRLRENAAMDIAVRGGVET
jgi:hypothetical protein